MLDAAELPRFDRVRYDPDGGELQLCWDHGFTLHIDLERDDYDDIEPFDHDERQAILGAPLCGDAELGEIHVTVPGAPGDPRDETQVPGVVKHFTPPLHPDDVTVHNGIPVTSPSRTLIDLAEVMTQDELREAFAGARELGLLDPEALRASRARVEWRPSLAMLDEVIEEFCD
jgi:hypothetical protein